MFELIKSFTIIDALDILIISYLIYRVLLLIKGTRAFQMVIGVVLIIFMSFLAKNLGFKTTNWVLSNFTGYLFIMIVILFQPEIRRALAMFGDRRFFGTANQSIHQVLDEIVRAASILANRQIGALIVIERESDIKQFIGDTGQEINGLVSKDLLISIFIPYSPLHDGAVLISDGSLKKAGAILPLSRKTDIGKGYGTRHRAAVGITEESDAVCVVVSEEKGSITIAKDGFLTDEMDAETLKRSLASLFEQPAKKNGKKEDKK